MKGRKSPKPQAGDAASTAFTIAGAVRDGVKEIPIAGALVGLFIDFAELGYKKWQKGKAIKRIDKLGYDPHVMRATIEHEAEAITSTWSGQINELENTRGGVVKAAIYAVQKILDRITGYASDKKEVAREADLQGRYGLTDVEAKRIMEKDDPFISALLQPETRYISSSPKLATDSKKDWRTNGTFTKIHMAVKDDDGITEVFSREQSDEVKGYGSVDGTPYLAAINGFNISQAWVDKIAKQQVAGKITTIV